MIEKKKINRLQQYCSIVWFRTFSQKIENNCEIEYFAGNVITDEAAAIIFHSINDKLIGKLAAVTPFGVAGKHMKIVLKNEPVKDLQLFRIMLVFYDLTWSIKWWRFFLRRKSQLGWNAKEKIFCSSRNDLESCCMSSQFVWDSFEVRANSKTERQLETIKNHTWTTESPFANNPTNKTLAIVRTQLE